MRRNRRQATGLAVSLFPFLAVLICTMGMLIVMLVLAVKSSAVKAQEAKNQHSDAVRQQRDELVDKLDLEQFRVEQIAQLRPGLQKRLEDERLRRSHLDEEIRKLVQEADLLSQQFGQLKQDESEARDSGSDDAEKIERLRQQIAERQLGLEQLRVEVAGRPVMYSIVPTRSIGGTLRRPIYIECTPTGILLQPSGIRIHLDEFTRPVLPGNPLDAALLATREYWNKFDAGSSEGEPYPLIVVRPGGATAYAIARRAMTSWDDEFGYELVEATRQLNWGESDPNLSNALQQAIQIARQRQNQMVAAGQAQWIGGPKHRMSGNVASDLMDATASSGTETARSHQMAEQFGDTASGNHGVDPPSFAANRGNGRPGIDTSKNDSLSRFASSETRSRSNPESTAGNPFRSARANSGQSTMQQRASGATTSAGAAQSGQAANGSGPAPPLSEQRGMDWALPTRTSGATPYRRPIRVECHEDHYLVHSSDSGQASVRVAIDQTVDVAIDELVNQVWKQIEGWGIAEIGGFWKPVLRLSTSSRSGARRADELASKLQGSGIEIERLWR